MENDNIKIVEDFGIFSTGNCNCNMCNKALTANTQVTVEGYLGRYCQSCAYDLQHYSIDS